MRAGGGSSLTSDDLLDVHDGVPFNGKYTALRVKLGDGGTAAVYVAHDSVTGEEAACKLARRRPNMSWTRARGMFEREAQLLQQCRHEHIVGFRALFVGSRELALVLDMVAGGDAQQLLQRHGALSERAVMIMVSQLASALEHLHNPRLQGAPRLVPPPGRMRRDPPLLPARPRALPPRARSHAPPPPQCCTAT